jgi:hypothetical protein
MGHERVGRYAIISWTRFHLHEVSPESRMCAHGAFEVDFITLSPLPYAK